MRTKSSSKFVFTSKLTAEIGAIECASLDKAQCTKKNNKLIDEYTWIDLIRIYVYHYYFCLVVLICCVDNMALLSRDKAQAVRL